MRYREFTPSPPLAEFVKCFWVLEAGPGFPVQTIYPDGCANRNSIWRSLLPPAAIHLRRQIYQRLKIAPSAVWALWAVRFHPHGSRAILPAAPI